MSSYNEQNNNFYDNRIVELLLGTIQEEDKITVSVYTKKQGQDKLESTTEVWTINELLNILEICSSLQEIAIAEVVNDGIIIAQIFNALANNQASKLQSISLYELKKLESNDIKSISNFLETNTSLQVFRLSFCKFSQNTSEQLLNALGKSNSLKMLAFTYQKNLSENIGTLTNLLKTTTSLQSLWFLYNKINRDDMVQIINALSQNDKILLQKLDIYEYRIENDPNNILANAITTLIDKKKETLQSFSHSLSGLSEDGIKSILNAMKPLQLYELDISLGNVNGIQALSNRNHSAHFQLKIIQKKIDMFFA